MLGRIENVSWNYVAPSRFYESLQERMWREHFFYSGFGHSPSTASAETRWNSEAGEGGPSYLRTGR